MQTFDLLNAPLQGTVLIEASAGTGKTYTITGLYLRLILENKITVNQILVVTFTEAATSELKDRIRNRLKDALAAFSGKSVTDELICDLHRKYADAPESRKLLIEALRDFDQAAIFTIHGFCMRMLRDNAFESGALFDTTLSTDANLLTLNLIEDFWRINFYRASAGFVKYARQIGISPETLMNDLGRVFFQKNIKIVPASEPVDFSDAEACFTEAFDTLRHAWPSVRESVEDLLTHAPELKRSTYRVKSIPKWIAEMDVLSAAAIPTPLLFDTFHKFTNESISAALKKNCQSPQHPFFDICDRVKAGADTLIDFYTRHILALKHALFDFVSAKAEEQKRIKNMFTFDDLLLRLHDALNGPSGEMLAEHIRSEYAAALIDEFQDTDPVQYEIFMRIFDTHKTFYLIGDPKQAIYSFRGADIFAYMNAAAQSEFQFTLDCNWRSHPGLVKAVNTMFSTSQNPFLFKEIQFIPVKAASNTASMIIDSKKVAPLEMWYIPADESGKPVTKLKARQMIAHAVAGEIAHLLTRSTQKRLHIGERSLMAGDIAVLVRKNREADLIKEALFKYKIPAVMFSIDKLFDSNEAVELLLVLSGIVFCSSDNAVKGALTTKIMGVSGDELEQLIENESAWETRVTQFKMWHDVWRRHGFMRMFKLMLKEEHILVRLMRFADGERQCTNVLHLMEVLHDADTMQKLGMEGVIKWLATHIVTPDQTEHLLRLESDEHAVKLVTMHKSKGLEYPVVFCPFTWSGSQLSGKAQSIVFHDPANDMRLTVDLEATNENKDWYEKELLAENLRLLYVALTRAKNRCYMVWGQIKNAETSAPAWLFQPPDKASAPSSNDARGMLETIVDSSEHTIRFTDLPEYSALKGLSTPTPVETLSCRRFAGHIRQSWSVESFTSLVSGPAYQAEIADHDMTIDAYIEYSAQAVENDEADMPTIFTFPRGLRAGTFLHEVFEHLDFTNSAADYRKEVVAGKLISYGFDNTWLNVVCGMVEQVLSVRLEQKNNTFKLSRITNKKRLNELEFYFPLKRTQAGNLAQVFKKHAASSSAVSKMLHRVRQLSFKAVQGFMKGFIDLVFEYDRRFYIVDWKSNFLGDHINDYRDDALLNTMSEHLYILQYLIYTVALNRYLQQRVTGYDYERHFGGIYYIFLRGVDVSAGPEFGVFRDRPSKILVDALNKVLLP